MKRATLIFEWKRANLIFVWNLWRAVRPIFGTLHGYQSSEHLVSISQAHHQQEQYSENKLCEINNASTITSFEWLICTDWAKFL